MVTKRIETSDYGITADDIDALGAAQSELAHLRAEMRVGDRVWLEDIQNEIKCALGAVAFGIRNTLPAVALHHRAVFESDPSPERTAAVRAFLTGQLISQLRPLRELIAKLEEPASAKNSR